MRPFRKPTLVTLRRQNPNQAWGFRLGGGAELGQAFQIQKVTPGSLAFLGGISENDELVRIGNISLRGLTHDEVQQIILRCTNCIDLFLVRDEGGEIEPRFLQDRPEIINEKTQIVYQDRIANIREPQIQHQSYVYNPYGDLNSIPQSNDSFNTSFSPQPDSNVEIITTVKTFNVQQHPPPQQQQMGFNASPQPFNQTNFDQRNYSPVSPTPSQSESYTQLKAPFVETKPGSPGRDTRVFGVKPRKSPLAHSISHDPSSVSPVSPQPPYQQQQQQYQHQQSYQPQQQSYQPQLFQQKQHQPLYSQSIPTTPTAPRNFNFNQFNNASPDMNNNFAGDKKVFGLPNKGQVKPIAPLGNHGVQPMANERKYFGVNTRQRFNSLSCERDWKDTLPIMNIPNTDQLLPSFTKHQQTYINQEPPTLKNLRPSLQGLERRRIRPVWPPPHPGSRSRTFAEGRDSPNTKMFNWPPRAQSVDRDFGRMTPDRCESPSPYFGESRVRRSSQVWPPPSNATPAGRSGYFPDENDNYNYAYTPSREASPAPGLVHPHIPATYRPPPNTQYTQVVDF